MIKTSLAVVVAVLLAGIQLSSAQGCWQCMDGCGDRTLEVCGYDRPWWILPDGTNVFGPKKAATEIVRKCEVCSVKIPGGHTRCDFVVCEKER